MIPVDRGARGKVMVEVLQRTKEELATGRQLIIYPEGTRRPPGAAPIYKYGIARLYRDLGLPVVPVAMHPGLFWPRRSSCAVPAISRFASCLPFEAGHGPGCIFAASDRRDREGERRAVDRYGEGQSAAAAAADAATRNCGSKEPRLRLRPERAQPLDLAATSSNQWSRMPISFRWASVLKTYSRRSAPDLPI